MAVLDQWGGGGSWTSGGGGTGGALWLSASAGKVFQEGD